MYTPVPHAEAKLLRRGLRGVLAKHRLDLLRLLLGLQDQQMVPW
jgi:hypothetical protein